MITSGVSLRSLTCSIATPANVNGYKTVLNNQKLRRPIPMDP